MLGLERLVERFLQKQQRIVDYQLMRACREMARSADSRKPPEGNYGSIAVLVDMLKGQNHREKVRYHTEQYINTAKQLCNIFLNSAGNVQADPELMPSNMGWVAHGYQVHRAWLESYSETGSTIAAEAAMLGRTEELLWLLGPEAFDVVKMAGPK